LEDWPWAELGLILGRRSEGKQPATSGKGKRKGQAGAKPRLPAKKTAANKPPPKRPPRKKAKQGECLCLWLVSLNAKPVCSVHVYHLGQVLGTSQNVVYCIQESILRTSQGRPCRCGCGGICWCVCVRGRGGGLQPESFLFANTCVPSWGSQMLCYIAARKLQYILN